MGSLVGKNPTLVWSHPKQMRSSEIRVSTSHIDITLTDQAELGLCCAQAHTLLFMVVYALILILPYTKWRDRLPAKPSFYRYIVVLFTVNLLAALGNLRSLTLACLTSPGSSDLQKKGQDNSSKPLQCLFI